MDGPLGFVNVSSRRQNLLRNRKQQWGVISGTVQWIKLHWPRSYSRSGLKNDGKEVKGGLILEIQATEATVYAIRVQCPLAK